MPRKDEDEEDDDEDEPEGPIDFFKVFSDPNNPNNLNKLFKSKQFKDLFKNIFEKLTKDFQGMSPEEIKKEFMKNKSKYGPIMYGFNVNIGPDGTPSIDSFGNIKTKPSGTPSIDSFGNIKTKPSGKPEVNSVREPMVEVNEEQNYVSVIAEMPGISKDDVEIKATSRSLTISTKLNASGRNYYKEIDLPCAINSDYAKARYQNGILEIKLKKFDEKQTDIKID